MIARPMDAPDLRLSSFVLRSQIYLVMLRPKKNPAMHLVPVISCGEDDRLVRTPEVSKSSIRPVSNARWLPFPDQLCAGDRVFSLLVKRPRFPPRGARGGVRSAMAREPVEGLRPSPRHRQNSWIGRQSALQETPINWGGACKFLETLGPVLS